MGRKGVRDEVLVWWCERFSVVMRLGLSLGLRDASAPFRRVGIEGADIVVEKAAKEVGTVITAYRVELYVVLGDVVVEVAFR